MDIAILILLAFGFIASFYLGRLFERAIFIEKSEQLARAQKPQRPVDRYYSLDREVQRRKE